MKREEVYLIELNIAGFRRNIPGRIIGIVMCTPEGLKPRLCYHI